MRPWHSLVFLLVFGCNFGGSDEAQAFDNACGVDSSCAVGVCADDICVDASSVSVDVAIEVLRSPSDVERATPVSWAFAPSSVSSAAARDLELPATQEIRGVVRWNGARVPATLRFVRRIQASVAPLSPVPVDVNTLREEAGVDDEEIYDFSVALVSGETYDVIVMPSSGMVAGVMEAAAPAVRSLPPLYLELQVDEATSGRFDVEFPESLSDPCSTILSTGCTLEADVLSSDGEEDVAEEGLQVRAIDAMTRRVVSSIAETDEDGHFAIRISDTVSRYLIRVTSSVGHDPFPAVSVDPEVAFAGDPSEKTIRIPRIDPVRVIGRVRDSADSSVPGATVRFLSTGIFGAQLGLEGSFSGTAVTDDEGAFSAELLLGFYSITVTPPEDVDNTWGILSIEALLGAEVNEANALIVPSQVGFAGSVATFRDESAAGVTVLARSRILPDPGATQRSQEAVSDETGAFAMSADAGLYDIHVKPAPETGFAWLVEPDISMSSEARVVRRDYRLNPPIPVRGVVRNSVGQAVPNTLIRAYVFRPTQGGADRRIQVAETMSTDDGSYRLLISPRLVGE